MTTKLQKMDLEIAALEHELSEIKKARAIFAETLELTPGMPEGNWFPSLVMEVAGQNIDVTTKQAVMLRILTSVDNETCVPANVLVSVVGNGRKAFDRALDRLRARLKKSCVPAEIVWFEGEGYRLQTFQNEQVAA